MAFELPTLPYSKTALGAKGMCEETLDLHHGKHHQAYVTALNGFVEKDPSLQGKSLDDIVKLSHNKPDMAPVFNNAGQHWNHILFWQCMSPNGGGIPGALEKKINEDFGDVTKFKDAFKAGGVGQFGSGWVWLVLGKRRQAEGDPVAERLQSAGHRRGQGAARLRRVGAQLLPGFPQPAPGLPAELGGQAGELRIRRGAAEVGVVAASPMAGRSPAMARSADAFSFTGLASFAAVGRTTLEIVSRSTVTRILGAISTSISLDATCLPSLSATIGTRCTVPTMPPPVTTRSPRFSAEIIWRVSFCFCCCGRISRK